MPAPSAAPPRRAGRPPKIDPTQRKRWQLYTDKTVHETAEARAEREHPERKDPLPDVMRALMADFAAGRVAPTAAGLAAANLAQES